VRLGDKIPLLQLQRVQDWNSRKGVHSLGRRCDNCLWNSDLFKEG